MGNTYRSRLAETYFNSLKIPGWHAISSGAVASENLNGHITKYAARIIERENMLAFAAPSWTQTTQENLSIADHIVFMENSVYERCRDILHLNIANFEIWKIADVNPNILNGEEINAITDATFLEIKKNVDQLITSL